MADNDNLSPDQTEKLLQFQDLTGLDDTAQCKEILQRHNWDIEIAVQARFAQEEGRADIYREQRSAPPVRTPPVEYNHFNQRVYTVARPRPQGWWDWGYFVITFPFRFFYTTVFDIFKFAYRLFRPDPRSFVTDPLGDVQRFTGMFEETYGPVHPRFFNGTYSDAINEAKTELQFLLVYIHGNDHPDTAQFCRSTLCNEEVVEFFDARLLFWACDVNSPEGYRVARMLRINSYPYLCLIVLRHNKMTVVARIQGAIGPQDLTTRLTRIISDNEASLIAARVDREERSFNRSLREEQDEAYLASLRVDQEKEKKKREEQEAREREEQLLLDQQREEEQKILDRERLKEELREQIPEEPSPDASDVIKVLLKLPNGTRLERHFRKSQSIKHLYNYVFVHEAAPDDFQIVTNFPRKVLPCEPTAETPEPPSFEDIGLGKSELLFVHDNEA